ncbi:MAG: aminoacyl-tRNA hydrolase [Rickettsiales bacterium]|jgi:PTH1 family peptidyl-tRNA hydrolase|nr:aminoacyl-tRNA hydrolase [Rickettsiales bacterium]
MDKSRNLLIAGLGNPGKEYDGTRHNAGFMAVDFLVGSDAKWEKKKNYLVCKTEKGIFIKPQTFMNLSGMAVQAAMAKYKIPLSNVLVIHDDIDLKPGDLRIKTGGGNAGHNGLKSISAIVGNDYTRVRIGVGRPEGQNYDISDWVVDKFTKSELDEVIKTFYKITVPNLSW